jgi:ABC-type nickel/cobalt efflux system permease component RcnA
VQALPAIALVSLVLLVATSVREATFNIANVTESTSFALIGLMGLWLIWSALRPQMRAEPALAEHGGAPGHGGHSHHAHHHHRHDKNCDCGHAHFPAASEVKGEWSWSKASSLAFSVGIRPCTGALLALIFANLAGIYWAGIASTFVMALGTAITVSIIAALAVYSRTIAMRLAARDRLWLDRVAFGLKLAGGAAIAAFGGILFWGSLWTTRTMM